MARDVIGFRMPRPRTARDAHAALPVSPAGSVTTGGAAAVPPVPADRTGGGTAAGWLAGLARRMLLPEPPAARRSLAACCAELAEVSVWTAAGRAWPDGASFVLRTVDGGYRLVGFADDEAAELVCRLRRLPGFDDRALLRLPHGDGSYVVSLWRAPAVVRA
jgi:hypothetical protein